jgi:hypothetical protein
MYPFEKDIQFSGFTYHLNFDPIFSPKEEKYFVSGNNDHGGKVAFEMKKSEYGTWTVRQPAPDWVSQVIQQLHNEIEGVERSRDEGRNNALPPQIY